MAHGGSWSNEQCLFLIVMKIATKLSWKKIAERFRERYGTTTNTKDCESKYNKELKDNDEKACFERFMQTSEVHTEDEGRIAAFAMVLLALMDPYERKF